MMKNFAKAMVFAAAAVGATAANATVNVSAVAGCNSSLWSDADHL